MFRLSAKMLSLLILLLVAACNVTGKDKSVVYSWEANRTEIPTNTDMVLLYGGSHHRPVYEWSADRVQPYVTYVDSTGVEHWLFDSFLFLEFMYTDKNDYSDLKAYLTGLRVNSANKDEWHKYLDYCFAPNNAFAALDSVVASASSRLGTPAKKRQVFVTLPEPITHFYAGNDSTPSDYWGEVDGVKLDFANPEDRVAAVKWFIDEARAMFNERDYKNIELAGFYWVAEHSTETASIIREIADYLHSFNYNFTWIPYFEADGFKDWKSYGFDYAYMQPNYYFGLDIPYERFEWTLNHVRNYDMDMEIEFDDTAVKAEHTPVYKPERLRDYLKFARENGVWENKRLAYYHGNDAIYQLAHSDEPEDKALYDEFCTFVISRPIRNN